MLLVKFTNYILGYVVFRAEGGFSERFINLCSNNNVFIWDVKRKGDCVYGCVEAADYKKLRLFAKKSGMKLRAERKAGLPFLFFHNKNRMALPLAAVFFAIVFFVLSKFIWTVDVVGNVSVPTEDIIAAFEELGVKPGKLKSSVNAGETADRALLLLDKIEWSYVNIIGCNATIEVKEKTDVPDVRKQSDVPTNIISSVSGTVRRIDLYKGTKCVNVGDYVNKGDVLVTGAVTNKDTSVSFYSSQAYVSVQTNAQIKYSFEKSRPSRIYFKTKKRYILSFFSFKLPLNFLFTSKEKYDFFESSSFLEVSGNKLPVGIICQRYDFYKQESPELEKDFSKLCAIETFMNTCQQNFSDKIILSKTLALDNDCVSGSFDVVQSAGEEVEMDIDLSSEPSKVHS